MSKILPKILVILGPTASGKTELALLLARKFNGEVINADSRQVYREMNIGTAKPAGEWGQIGSHPAARAYIVAGVPHHLMDIVSPDAEFTLADFKARAREAIADIVARGKLPIVVGGTGLYISALVDNLDIPAVAPDAKLRAELEQKPLAELVRMLKETDPESAGVVDLLNPRRVERALEVALTTGESFVLQKKKGPPLYDAFQIGLNPPREELYARIEARVDEQIDEGLVDETRALATKYDWDLPSMTGIGYRQIGYFLRGEKTLPEAAELLKRDSRHYAKRQMSWFKRDGRIKWIKNFTEAEKLAKDFLV